MNRLAHIAIAAIGLTTAATPTWAQTGDVARGERVFRTCVACHALEPHRNMTGPSPAELWNPKAGRLSSFNRYSPALKSSGIVWDDKTLDEWLKDRNTSFPGTP
jgi:cytochrome c